MCQKPRSSSVIWATSGTAMLTSFGEGAFLGTLSEFASCSKAESPTLNCKLLLLSCLLSCLVRCIRMSRMAGDMILKPGSGMAVQGGGCKPNAE